MGGETILQYQVAFTRDPETASVVAEIPALQLRESGQQRHRDQHGDPDSQNAAGAQYEAEVVDSSHTVLLDVYGNHCPTARRRR